MHCGNLLAAPVTSPGNKSHITFQEALMGSSSIIREDLGNNQVMLSNEVASIVVHQDMLPGLNLKKIFKPMQVSHDEALVTSILEEMDTSLREVFAEVEDLEEFPPYEGRVCSMREERPAQEHSFMDLLISGAILR
jgi:hypothetical protein